MDKTMQRIKEDNAISIDDKIVFRTIFDIISGLFSDENGKSKIHGQYMINEKEKLFVPCISKENKIDQDIQNGFSVYFLNDDFNTLYIYEKKDSIKKQKKFDTFKNLHFVTFAKLMDKKFTIGFHFIGIYELIKFTDEDKQTMVFKRIQNTYNFK